MTTPSKIDNNINQSGNLTDQTLKNNTAQSNNNQDRNFDIVLFGATSFVGKLTAEYLAKFLTDGKWFPNADLTPTSSQDHSTTTLRFAIAGRDNAKLETLKQSLLAIHDQKKAVNKISQDIDIAIIIADSDDESSLEAMVKQTRVIISTVGPYLTFGENLIKACANVGTDYVDLTGEAIFIKDMMDRYQDAAKRSGARIVNSCGFDSIPSDLGVYFTQKTANAQFDEPCSEIHMRVKAAKGGLSGGTVASMATIFGEVGHDKARRRQLANPYLLNDDPNVPTVRQEKLNKPQYDIHHNRWLAPFVMESINSRIVHRSNQLQDYAYGRDFKYDEAVWMSDGIKGQLMSVGMSAGIIAFAVAMSNKTSRQFLSDHVLPKSGTGPSKTDQDQGYFDIRFFGQTPDQKLIATQVTGDKDPGYGSTSRMLAQAALCLALDVAKSDIQGGFWTPASALGDKLIERLEAFAGIHFSVIEEKA